MTTATALQKVENHELENGQDIPTMLTPTQKELLRRTFCRGASDDEIALLLNVANRTGLDPLRGQIRGVMYKNSRDNTQEMSIQIGIDGFRLIAARHPKHRGFIGPFWCGKDGEWKDVWLSNDPPFAAKMGIRHADYPDVQWAVAKFSSYFNLRNKTFWDRMGEVMLANRAEALIIRRVYPQETKGLAIAGDRDIEIEIETEPEPVSRPNFARPYLPNTPPPGVWQDAPPIPENQPAEFAPGNLVPDNWLPTSLQKQGLTFEDLAKTKAKEKWQNATGKEFAYRAVLHFWERETQYPKKMETAKKMLSLFPSETKDAPEQPPVSVPETGPNTVPDPEQKETPSVSAPDVPEGENPVEPHKLDQEKWQKLGLPDLMAPGWIDTQVPFKKANGLTWRDLAEGKPLPDGKDGRKYLEGLANWKDKPEIQFIAQAAIEQARRADMAKMGEGPF